MELMLKDPLQVLLVDDDEDEFVLLKDLMLDIQPPRFNLDWADTTDRALSAYQKKPYDVYLIDYRLGSASGLDLLQELIERGIKAPVILLTGKGNPNIDVAAQAAGVADYLTKDQLNSSQLERTIRYAIEHKSIQAELERRVQERTRSLQVEVQERKQAKEAAWQSEARFRALAETISAAIFIVREMIVRYANPAARIVTGFDLSEMVEQDFIRLIHPDYRTALLQHGLGNPWSPDLPSRYELKIIRKDGQERWLDLTTGPIEYEGQAAWIVTAFDTTEREQAELELRQARNDLEERVNQRTAELQQANVDLLAAVDEVQKRAIELEALQTATSVLLTTLDLEGLLGNILDAVRKAIPAAEKGSLYFILPKEGRVKSGDAAGFKDARIHIGNLEEIKGYPGRVIRSHEPLSISRVSTKARDAGKKQETQAGRSGHSIIAAPLLHHDEPLGAILLESSQPGAFSEADQHLLLSFATTAAAAIRNAQLHREVSQAAVTDPLTGIFNRRGFFEEGQRELDRFHRYGHPLSVIFMDVDNLKSLNDEYGHTIGDQVLQAAVERTCLHLRQVDLIGRIGGDEFAILLPETGIQKAQIIAERIREEVTQKPLPIDLGSIRISATLGVIEAHNNLYHLDTLLAHADKAFYEAKQNGRNQVVAR